MKKSNSNFILGLLFISGLLSLTTSMTAQEGLPVQEGLVGYWSFDAMDGQYFQDHTPFEHRGKGEDAFLIAGKKGNAIYFDGNRAFGQIENEEELPPAHFNSLGKGSIAFWFRVDHIPLDHGIAPLFYYGNAQACDFFDAANEGLIIEVGHSPIHPRSEYIYFTMWKNGCTYPSFCFDSNSAISTGEWHHIVVVVDENSNTGYLDGKEMTGRLYNFGNASDSQFFEDAISPEKLWLGRGHWDRTEQYLEGAMDELMIYKRALGAAEVAAIYRDTTGAISGINSNTSHHSPLELFPIPAESVVTVKTLAGSKIGIYSMEGVLLMEQLAGTEYTEINISSLSPGLYVARSGDRKKKFLVE